MALYEPETGTFNDTAFALDTVEAEGGGKSLFESAGEVITKGIPLTGLSIVNSFANTAIDIGNFFGGDTQRWEVDSEVEDENYKDYYKKHAQGIEAAGLLAGSLIPGLLSIKALQVAQAGRLGVALARATGIFSGPKKAIIENALMEIEGTTGTTSSALYGAVNADKYKAIALGFGDQALQGLVYETATLATMKASPLLDKDGFNEVVENMFYGALVGGGIGGVLEGIGTRGIFNRALLKADTDTKQQEIANYLGKGGYFAGDRVVALLDSIDQIPAATNRLGSKKLQATTDAAILNSKKILGSMVEPGDEELTTTMFETLMKMKKDQNLDKEEMYNYLARLAKVSRMDSEPSVATGSIVYINQFVKNADAEWSQLASLTPAEGSEFSFGYKMREFAISPKVARFNDTVSWEGMDSRKFNSPADAFDKGYDVYIDDKLRSHVNPEAPNIERVARAGESRPLSKAEEAEYRKTGKLPEGSKPLYGAPIILDTKTGGISESALPVVGDYGKVKLLDKGLQYGEKFSVQDLAKPITKDTKSLDANARYVWAATRGVLRGDIIQQNDIAMLEQLWRQGNKYATKLTGGIEAFMEDSSITLAGFEGIPSQHQLLNLIRDAKDDLIHDLLSKDMSGHVQLRGDLKNDIYFAEQKLNAMEGGSAEWRTQDKVVQNLQKEYEAARQHSLETARTPKFSSAEVAQRAGVPESYLANSLKASSPEAYILDHLQDSAVLRHVKMEYDIGSLYAPDGQILRGMMDVQYRMQVVNDALESAVARHFGGDYEQFIADGSSSDANIVGVGAKAFSSSNANYGTLGQEMERIGRRVTDWITKRMAEVSEKLSSATNAIRDDEAAAAELGMFRAVRQRTSERYSFLPEHLLQQEGMPAGTVVLTRSIRKNSDGMPIGWNKDLVPEGFIKGEKPGATNATAGLSKEDTGLRTSYQLSGKVAAFEKANQEVNDYRLVARNNWYASQGLYRSMEPGSLYTPAIDTTKYPHFALVKARPGTGLADDSTSIITAETAADLEQKIASLRDEYSVYTKDMLKTHHEVLGDYEYNRNFAQSGINNELSRRGILNDVYPDTRAESIIKDYIDWHTKQELRLTRDFVEIGNAQLFAELRAMGERFTAAETSKTGFVQAALGKTTPNPYNSYVKTALGISDRDEYRLWADANEKLEAFFSTGFRVAKAAFTAAHKGLLPYEDAAKMAEKFGLGNPYAAATDAMKAYYEVANKLPPERYLSKFVSTANSVLAATAIRLDVFQSVINAVSTPVLLLAEANSARTAEMAKLITTELPDGSGRLIPATAKLFHKAVANWFSQDSRTAWMPLYKQIGAVRERSSDYFQMIDQLTLPYGKFSESQILAKIKAGTDLGAKLTGSELSEEFGRFIAADTGRQIFEAAGYAGKELTDNISTFVNRVHGNYIASQRPVAFQGPLGQAVGLFQTYQFNLLNQLFRYVENGQGKTLAILAGMQTTLFGMQGLPGFQAINNHIIGNAAGNPAHKDLYSTLPNLLDKKLGDYLLYGTLSNWMSTGLYGRGDINPRQITILPTNPLDYPAISGGIKFVGSLLDTAQKVAQGGGLPASLLLGLEHNGLSRPLAGIAQMVQGYSTTGKGSLVASTRPGTLNPMGDNSAGLSEYATIASYSRLLGARPLDEAVVMDAMYRRTLYQAKDSARVSDLGQAVKTKLYGNQALAGPELESFATRYAAAGGRIETFGRKMLEWSRDANSSVANQTYNSLRSPLNQQMMLIMGGTKLPDYNLSTPKVSPGAIAEGSETTPQ